MPRILIIAGPTASGKSALAVAAAQALDGVILNADSMQIYDALPILTAQPTAAERRLAPHRLFGVLRADDPCSVARWRAMAAREIAALGERWAIVAGGSGLYLAALRDGLAVIPDIPPAVRASTMARHAEIGPQAFHAELAQIDPHAAARLPPGDSQRLIRAVEVWAATGEPLSAWLARPRLPPPANWHFTTLALQPPRPALYAAIERRLHGMIEHGALREVRECAAISPELPAMKALGVAPLRAHLAGDIGLAEAVALTARDQRRYAKRQMTWMRHQLTPDMAHPALICAAQAPNIIAQFFGSL